MKENIVDKRLTEFSSMFDFIQTLIIYLTSFLIPTFLGKILNVLFTTDSVIASNSQIIIVNTLLIISALNLKGWKKILGVVTMPSISTIVGGYVFKTSSVYMVYMIPWIWLGNFALIYVYKLFIFGKNRNYLVTSILSILIKVCIIFIGFNILKLFGIFPEKIINLLTVSMGIIQLVTASIGAIIAFGIYKLEKNNN